MVLKIVPSEGGRDNCRDCPFGGNCSEAPVNCGCIFYDEQKGKQYHSTNGRYVILIPK